MLKLPVLIFLVLHLSVLQNRPKRGDVNFVQKKKFLQKMSKRDIGLINVKNFIFFTIGPMNAIKIVPPSFLDCVSDHQTMPSLFTVGID